MILIAEWLRIERHMELTVVTIRKLKIDSIFYKSNTKPYPHEELVSSMIIFPSNSKLRSLLKSNTSQIKK